MKDSNKELTEEVYELLCKAHIDNQMYSFDKRLEIVSKAVSQLIQSECKRFALECVPNKRKELCGGGLHAENWARVWNDCREQMIKNIDSKVG